MLSILVAAVVNVRSTSLQFQNGGHIIFDISRVTRQELCSAVHPENERATHKLFFICVTDKSVRQSTAQPENISMYGGRNWPCSPACAPLVDLTPLPT